MKKIPRFVIRTIRDGKVKVFGKIYYADNSYKIYDGRLDGMRYVFGVYKKYTRKGIVPDDTLCLWGSERAYQGLEKPDEGPDVVDGYLPWAFWHVK